MYLLCLQTAALGVRSFLPSLIAYSDVTLFWSRIYIYVTVNESINRQLFIEKLRIFLLASQYQKLLYSVVYSYYIIIEMLARPKNIDLLIFCLIGRLGVILRE